MKYEFCVKPLDGTPQGDIPKYYIKEYDSDKDALGAAAAMDYATGKVDPAQKYDIMMVCPQREIGVILSHYDPSGGFVFYIKNLTKDTMVFENSCEDPSSWLRELNREDDPDEGDEDLIYDAIDNLRSWQ